MSTDACDPHLSELPSPPDDEVVVRIRDPGDVLAMVRHTFGYTPRDSLVLIALHGGRTGAHLRLDLAPAADDPDALAKTAAESLAGAGLPSMPSGLVALLYMGEAPAPPSQGDPQLRPGAALHRSLERWFGEGLGIDLVQVWHVGGGYVRDFDCLDEVCCPYPGTPVESAVGSLVDAHMVYRGSQVAEDPADLVDTMLREPTPIDPELTATIRRDLHALRTDPQEPAEERLDDVLALWDVAVDGSAEAQEPAGADAWVRDNADVVPVLIGSLEDPGLRDAVLVLAAADRATAQLCDESSATHEPPARVLLGATGRAPAWDRIERLSRVLTILHAVADGRGASEILALLAWIEWSKGRGAVCGELVARAEAVAPGHQLSGLLGSAAALGMVCPWARVREHSWAHHHRRDR
ncbi:DUF4192 domain-containing protein [Nesterenkonia marinintestina]|uniref:DUF4192 domain-containing protein n=1 Tax=Nesterenkonia marinintestina TaxID=2979865 RepID=UPI0021BE967C|nr:DUF4192 domain-containing protein [Nesterenkonia sp. GX14115]